MNIRPIERQDCPTLLTLVKALAAEEKKEDAVKARAADYETAFFVEKTAKALVVEDEGILIGYAIYYYRFYSYEANRVLWIDDLFVARSFRQQHLGIRLIQSLAQIASDQQCSHMEWGCLPANTKALAFYARLGAVIDDSHITLRFDQEKMNTLITYQLTRI